MVPESLVGPQAGALVRNIGTGLLLVGLFLNLFLALLRCRDRDPDALTTHSFQWVRIAWFTIVLGLSLRFLFDNLSLQPWAYQTWIFGWIFAFAPKRSVGIWLRLVATSIYFFSALGKFDYQFVHTVGQDMLEAVFTFARIPTDSFSMDAKAKLAIVFPATELFIALGLAWKRTRQAAAIFVMLMHASLIAILGPWNLNHSLGVLTWNIVLFVQAWFLFSQHRRWEIDSGTSSSFTLRWMLVSPMVLFLVLAPLMERRGLWDHWTSWSLYSPHTSRVRIEIHQSTIEKLPTELQKYIHRDEDGDRWYDFSIKQWALETKGVPIYPQARYQLALADRIATRFQLDRSIRAIEQSVSDRMDGSRTEFRMLNAQEIHDHTGFYSLSSP